MYLLKLGILLSLAALLLEGCGGPEAELPYFTGSEGGACELNRVACSIEQPRCILYCGAGGTWEIGRCMQGRCGKELAVSIEPGGGR